MPAPYSLDLRLRCIEAIRRGETESAVAQWAGIAVRTVKYWKQRYAKQGNVQPITDFRRGPQSKVDREKLKLHIESSSDKKLNEIGKELGFSATTVGRHLKAMGYTRKKRHSYTANEKNVNALNLKKN
jgi:putative transposase